MFARAAVKGGQQRVGRKQRSSEQNITEEYGLNAVFQNDA
jgi:hypothetical protein